MPATTRREEMEGRPMTTRGRPMTSKTRPMTSKGRPVTTTGRRPQQGSVESLESRTSSENNNGSKEDSRLLNHGRARTAPTSKYHNSCSLSSGSDDSPNSNTPRSKSMTAYPGREDVSRVSNRKPGYYEFLRPYSAFTKPLYKMPRLPVGFQDSKKLTHKSLTEDERFYLWRTATVYGMSGMRKANQQRYEKMLWHTVETGFHTEEEIQPYLKYFQGSRKRQFHPDPSVWRDPPRIPVRPQHFRPPPTSQQGWNSTSPRGNLGSGRGHSAQLASTDKNDEKELKEKKDTKARKKRAPGVPSDDELEKEDDQQHENHDQKLKQPKHERKWSDSNKNWSDKKQPKSADSPRDKAREDEQQEDNEEDETSVHIYYDMKLKRTVVKPKAAGDTKDEKDSDKKLRKSKENKVSFKFDQGKKKDQKGQVAGRGKVQDKPKGKLNVQQQKQNDQKSPRPPLPRRSWEKKPADDASQPKTSRGRSRAQTEMESEKQERADDDEEAGDGRQSAASSTSRASSSASSYSTGSSSSTSSSGSSTSGSSSSSSSGSSSSTSSRSSSVISRSDSAMSKNSSGRNSRNTPDILKLDDENSGASSPRTKSSDKQRRPKAPSAVGNQVIEGDDNESRAALANKLKPSEQQTTPKSSLRGTDDTRKLASTTPNKTNGGGTKGSSSQSSENKSKRSGSNRRSGTVGRSDSPSGKTTPNGIRAKYTPSIRVRKKSKPDGANVAHVQQANNSALDDDDSASPKAPSAVGNRVVEGDDDEARAAMAKSFWGSPNRKNKLPVYQEPSNSHGGSYKHASDGDQPGGSGVDAQTSASSTPSKTGTSATSGTSSNSDSSTSSSSSDSSSSSRSATPVPIYNDQSESSEQQQKSTLNINIEPTKPLDDMPVGNKINVDQLKAALRGGSGNSPEVKDDDTNNQSLPPKQHQYSSLNNNEPANPLEAMPVGKKVSARSYWQISQNLIVHPAQVDQVAAAEAVAKLLLLTANTMNLQNH